MLGSFRPLLVQHVCFSQTVLLKATRDTPLFEAASTPTLVAHDVSLCLDTVTYYRLASMLQDQREMVDSVHDNIEDAEHNVHRGQVCMRSCVILSDSYSHNAKLIHLILGVTQVSGATSLAQSNHPVSLLHHTASLLR